MVKTIEADWNAQTETGLIRLNTRGALESLARTPVTHGELVWLEQDGERVQATIVIKNGKVYGNPVWATMRSAPVPA
jgi:hypothetical protein